MSQIHFGTDGWRARFDEGFTPENVVRVADAAGALIAQDYPGKTVYVGYDTRKDAQMYAHLAASILSLHGLHAVLSHAYCPTPTLCWTIAQDPDAAAGLQLTASHNPGDYLGIKVRMADGGASPAWFTDKIEATLPHEARTDRGEVETRDILTPYFNNLRTLVDVDALQDAHLKVVHDPMYGASRNYMTQIFEDMGIQALQIHGEECSDFAGLHPEPIHPWIDECVNYVCETGAVAGLINDGDADRIGAVDEDGSFVSPHLILCLMARHLASKGQRGRIVVTMSYSQLVKRMAEDLGLEFKVVPVGFKWIYDEMLKGDVLIGGEESGGIGIPTHVLERDGLYGDLMLCELMATSHKTLKELVAEVQQAYGPCCYARRDLKLTVEQTDAFKARLAQLPSELEELYCQFVTRKQLADVSTQVVMRDARDGLRAEFVDGSWMLMRPSGTEPLVRVYAEASTERIRDILLEFGCELARGVA